MKSDQSTPGPWRQRGLSCWNPLTGVWTCTIVGANGATVAKAHGRVFEEMIANRDKIVGKEQDHGTAVNRVR